MQNTNLDGRESSMENTSSEFIGESRIIQTDVQSKNGQNKCPKCGATDISLNTKNGHLRCNYCRFEFESGKVMELEDNLGQLKGEVIGSGAQDIVENADNILTFKCSSCGAEVVIDTTSSFQARCHWCRNILSVNQQIPNGAIPDAVLPFRIPKEEAKEQIERFVGKRKFFAHPDFKREFISDNVMGVYFPYMIIDVNAHAQFVGKGEHLVRRYTRRSGNNERTYYDADVFHIEREFDLVIQGLTIESNSNRISNQSSNRTNNIINSIMPFDVENAIRYDSNYLRGYTAERRDINVDQLKTLVDFQSQDIARFSANKTLNHYDRGVAWSTENLQVKGQQWKAAYLPVWLYSYQQVKGKKKILHYVAVNARTKETMGSIPIHMPKLIVVSLFIEMLGVFFLFSVDIGDDFGPAFILFLPGLIYFAVMLSRYRNSEARHMHEIETKTEMSKLRKVDDFISRKTGLSSSMMHGTNNENVNGLMLKNRMQSSLRDDNKSTNLVNDKFTHKNEKL